MSDSLPHNRSTLCHECGLIVNIDALREGQKAACPRCRYVITRLHKNAIDRILIFSLTAMILLILSNSFSFIVLSAQGQEREIALIETVRVLFSLNEWALALFMLVVIIGIPVVFTVALCWLVILIKFEVASHRAIGLLRVIEALRFWNMAEIFFLGIIVSMVKVVSLADITFGISFWTYALFSLFLIATLLHVDKFQLAHRIKNIAVNKGGVVNGDV